MYCTCIVVYPYIGYLYNPIDKKLYVVNFQILPRRGAAGSGEKMIQLCSCVVGEIGGNIINCIYVKDKSKKSLGGSRVVLSWRNTQTIKG